ncbi:MerR family transcriptional regulator [Massilia terrae]|uniref:MerR family transcriptional regulator n=1 Tax=Massilia terrae TaxID=1811224 RepID=A0ABT2D116_9BURK|nr:MerR family transcriptional regulator [Massilia terrae]MCS0659936.1 MerR family transcriptional regulator [Massilia terrae]
MLKIGELAQRTGLTVRTLHHYDSIGLLRPSARSDAGYRLYNRDDVARLQQIQALRKFGMALADIGAYLDSPDSSPLAIIERQLASLDQQIAEASQMRQQLLRVHAQLAQGEQPELATWLTTLEQMTMYDKYFTKQEQERLPLLQDPGAPAQWRSLVEEIRQAMDDGLPPQDECAKALAQRWVAALTHNANDDHFLAFRLSRMHENEPEMQRATGVTPELKQYVVAAMGELKTDIYRKHLPPEVIERMQRYHQAQGRARLPMIEQLKGLVQDGVSPAAPAAQVLARQWLASFRDMLGDDPAIIARYKALSMEEPLLRMGRGMTDEMIAFIDAAMDIANKA